jgi:hypothetical protein
VQALVTVLGAEVMEAVPEMAPGLVRVPVLAVFGDRHTLW